MPITPPMATAAQPTTPPSGAPDGDYRFVLMGALQTTVLLLAAKMGAALWLNSQFGGSVSVARWAKVVPYLVFEVNRSDFASINALSTLASAVVGTLMIISTFRRGAIGGSVGRLGVPLSTAWMISIDGLLHVIRSQYTVPKWLIVTFVLFVGQLVLVTNWLTRRWPEVRQLAERYSTPLGSSTHLASVAVAAAVHPAQHITPHQPHPTFGDIHDHQQ
jgi:branched-subunit amino acid transport protein AzlD